jgi:hypothetical protein
MDRKEEQVRRLLDTPHPAVATDLVVLLAMWWPTPDPLDTTPSTGF